MDCFIFIYLVNKCYILFTSFSPPIIISYLIYIAFSKIGYIPIITICLPTQNSSIVQLDKQVDYSKVYCFINR